MSTPNFTIIDPRESIEYFLNRERSGPALGLDTEFNTAGGSIPTCQADITGLSMAGGTPETGYIGTFWPFTQGRVIHEWGYLRDKLLLPVFGDPTRTMVMHPPKTDMQILRPRGITEDRVKCQIECTMSMVHVFDENLPKGLKDLGQHVLHLDVVTHSEMQKKMKAFLKEGKKLGKDILAAAWEVYKVNRKPWKREDGTRFEPPLQADIDPSWPSWHKETMKLPPKLTKGEMETRLGIIARVVEGHYADLAAKEFATYGALDALITLAIRYFFKQDMDPAFWTHVERETEVCHPFVTEMEERGLHINVDRLAAIHGAMKIALDDLRAEVMALWQVRDEEITVDADEGFNPGSPEQVQKKLWIDWELRPPPWAQQGGEIKPKYRAGKLGLCSSNKDVLGWLAVHAPEPQRTAVAKLLEFRKFNTLFGTFVAPMLERAMRDPERRVHASFWPVGARTGRFSSDEPNVENIPRPSSMPKMKIPEGADPVKPPPGLVIWKNKKTKVIEKWQVDSLRQVFIAPDVPLVPIKMKLISVDLSQIENRLMAHESQDPRLLWLYRSWDCGDCKQTGETDQPLHACPNCGSKDGKRDKLHPDQPVLCTPENVGKRFCLGRDIHAFTALGAGYVEKFGAEEGRERGKTLNHAFSYGMGAATKARRDGESVKEAEEALQKMRTLYGRVPELHASTMTQVREQGYVEMFNGQRRRFYVARLLLKSNNFHPWEWEGIVREAVNVKAQGGTGVIMKIGMTRARRKIRERAKTDPRWRHVHFVNQVHDEVVIEAPESIAEEVKNLVVYELEHAVQLRVPVIADGKTGYTWGDAH